MGEDTNEDILNAESGEAEEEEYYDPHPLRPVVDLMLRIIDAQLDVIQYMGTEYQGENGPDPCAEDKQVVTVAALRVIRRMQDRLLKMSFDLPLDDKLISLKKYALRNSPPTVTDTDESQAQ